jgi:hypothetical protein
MQFDAYPGLEVTTIGASLGRMLDLGPSRVSLDMSREEQLKMFDFFATRIVTWNVEHPDLTDDERTPEGLCVRCGLAEDMPLPTTITGLLCLDPSFITALIMGWMEAVTRVSGPKGQSTNDGGLNMQALMSQLANLQSPQTLPTLNLS